MQDHFEQIEDYLQDQLSPEERTAFKAAMALDASLRAAVDNYGDATLLSEGLLELDVMETLAGLRGDVAAPAEEEQASAKKPQRKIVPLLLAAAVLIALVFLAQWWYKNDQEQQANEKWFAESYVRPIDPDATKSIDTVGMDPLQLGKYYFALNDFERSEYVLRNLLKQTSDQDTTSKAAFWLGHALVNQGEWEGRGLMEE